MPNPAQADDSKENAKEKQRIPTGLLLVASAFLGGIAVVFWNRRTLTTMKNRDQNSPEKPSQVDEDAIY